MSGQDPKSDVGLSIVQEQAGAYDIVGSPTIRPATELDFQVWKKKLWR